MKQFLNAILIFALLAIGKQSFAQQKFVGVFQYPANSYAGNHYTNLRWFASGRVEIVDQKVVVRVIDWNVSVAPGSNYKLGSELIPWSKFQPFMSKFENYTSSFLFLLEHKNGKKYEARIEYNAQKNISSDSDGYVTHLSDFPGRNALPSDFKILNIELYWSNQRVDYLMEKQLKK